MPLAAVQGNVRARGPGIGIVGVDGQAFGQPCVGLCGVALVQIDLRFERIAGGYVGPTLDNGVSFEQRLVVVFHVQTADGPVEPETRHQRIQSDGLSVVADGLLIFFLTDARDGAQVEYLLNIGIQFYGLGGILLSPHVVIQIELGHRTVVPRQPQIGLQCQHLVEILDGEHIIFIVQGHLAAGNQPVHIVLGTRPDGGQ